MENFSKKVYAIADVGVSLTKICYRVNDGSIQYLTQPSGILQIHPDLYEDKLHLADRNTAVVKLSDGTAWVVGEKAGREPAEEGDKSLTAIAKIVASIGQVCSEAGHLSLAVMLPTNEEEGFIDFSEQLTEEVYSAKFNGTRLGLTLSEQAKIFPEGAGLATLIDDGILLMFGQKDVSLLQVEGGRVRKSRCFVGWGMIKLLSQSPVPVTDEITTAHAVFRFLLKNNDQPLNDLFGSRTEKVIAKLPTILEGYWLELGRKISAFPAIADSDRIYVGGGNAPIMTPLVAKTFRQKTEAKCLLTHVSEHFPDLDKKPLAYRLSDPLALYLHLWGS